MAILMKKDALIIFLIFLALGIIFTWLVAMTINNAVSNLEDLESFFGILINIGVTGYFYGAMALIFDVLAFISFFKVWRD
jgi:hypothetical protein